MSARLAPLEQALVSLLADKLVAQVGTRVPTQRPARFIRLSRTGGMRIDLAESRPTILIECWARDEADAWELCRDAWELLAEHIYGADLKDGVTVTTADVTEPVSYPDSATGTPRYQFIYTPIVIIEGAST